MTHIPAAETEIAVAKRSLRTEMRRRRAALADRPTRSALIWVNALDLCGPTARVGASTAGPGLRVMAFHGVGSEPDTTSLLELLESAGHTVLLPRVDGDHIVAVVHAVGATLQPGAHGVPAPVGAQADPTTIDVVLVPGLAFTRDGRRLGQGGGYYDRFLPLLRPDCITCGVGFDVQVVENLPSEPHDHVLTTLITDANPSN